MNHETNTRDVVIIGNGISGITAADAARQNNAKISITVISNEIYPTYYRLRLCELLGKDDDDYSKIFLYSSKWYDERKIETVLGKKAVSILADEKKLLLDTGENISYGKLIISCGSSSNFPDIPGNKKKGVAALWSLNDVIGIRQMVKPSSRVVISGGGLLGLETAYQLSQKGVNVSIVEFSPHLLSKQLDKSGSLLFEKKVKSLGIDLYLGTHAVSINGNDSVEEIVLDNGDSIKADFIIFTAGVKPNTYLAGNSGIEVNRGIVVDKRMLTSNPEIYACGDVAEFEGYMSGQWISAINQGKVAGTNASGGNIEYANEYSPYFLNTMGMKLYSIGDVGKKGKVYDIIEESNLENYEYQKLYFEEGKCTGGILMGNVKNFSIISNFIKNHLSKEEVLNLLYK